MMMMERREGKAIGSKYYPGYVCAKGESAVDHGNNMSMLFCVLCAVVSARLWEIGRRCLLKQAKRVEIMHADCASHML